MVSFRALQRPPFLLVVILDGLGVCNTTVGNAYFQAATPCLDFLQHNSLYRTLGAHGPFVGLSSWSDQGNSEVGHNAMGAGRIVPQGKSLVDKVISSRAIYHKTEWQEILNRLVGNDGKTLHLMGLLSDGGVHSHIDHLLSVIEQASIDQIPRIRVHALLDGRDVSPHSGSTYIDQLETVLQTKQRKGFDYQIASMGGREVICMDRYGANWKMIQQGWDLIVDGIGDGFPTATQGYQERKKHQQAPATDQNIQPFCVMKDGTPIGKVQNGDVCLWMNFRGDRSMQMCQAFTQEHLSEIKRTRRPDIFFVGLTQYDAELQIPKHFLVHPVRIENCVGEVLIANKIRSFALSETQKYGHVTYFWNGNRSGYLDTTWERYIEIPSIPGPSNCQPKMQATAITDATICLLQSGMYQTGRINFPNPDMVGHTGDFAATVLAVEHVDRQLQRIYHALQKIGGTLLVTADHGNCEEMLELDLPSNFMLENPSGLRIKTSHTTNRVPLFLQCCQNAEKWKLQAIKDDKAGLSNIASTILRLLRIAPPKNYHPSLVEL